MSWSLFWKSFLFSVVVLFALAFGTALVPGADKWPEAVYVAACVVIALGYMRYLKRKQRADPEAYMLSPQARRNWLIASVPLFSVIAVTTYLDRPNDALNKIAAMVCGTAALISAYRLFNEMRHPHNEPS